WSASLGPNHPYVARGLDYLAEVVASRGGIARAHALYTRALAIRKRALGAAHPDVAWTLTSLARTDAASGNLVRALKQVDEAIDIYRRTDASEEPDHLARTFALKGDLEMRLGQAAVARASFADALATRERLFGPAHPLAAEARADMAAADFALGSYDRALEQAL